MSQSSFEIKTAKDLYFKLVREHERIMADLWSSDHAINFSITAHHLYKDWLKRELFESDYLKLKAEIESRYPPGQLRVTDWLFGVAGLRCR